MPSASEGDRSVNGFPGRPPTGAGLISVLHGRALLPGRGRRHPTACCRRDVAAPPQARLEFMCSTLVAGAASRCSGPVRRAGVGLAEVVPGGTADGRPGRARSLRGRGSLRRGRCRLACRLLRRAASSSAFAFASAALFSACACSSGVGPVVIVPAWARSGRSTERSRSDRAFLSTPSLARPRLAPRPGGAGEPVRWARRAGEGPSATSRTSRRGARRGVAPGPTRSAPESRRSRLTGPPRGPAAARTSPRRRSRSGPCASTRWWPWGRWR